MTLIMAMGMNGSFPSSICGSSKYSHVCTFVCMHAALGSVLSVHCSSLLFQKYAFRCSVTAMLRMHTRPACTVTSHEAVGMRLKLIRPNRRIICCRLGTAAAVQRCTCYMLTGGISHAQHCAHLNGLYHLI